MRYALIALTAICCLPFVFMLTVYVSWRQNSPPPTGADIGWGMVILSSFPAVASLFIWLIYGLFLFMTSKSLPIGPEFNGWKRRTGLILLVISCLFCAGWVRSLYTTDSVQMFGGRFDSHDGLIERYATTHIVVGRIGGAVTTMYWSVPYTLILGPLVLASAYLLLSKPRHAGKPLA